MSESFAWADGRGAEPAGVLSPAGAQWEALENYPGVAQMDLCGFVSAVGPCPMFLMSQAAFLPRCCPVSPCSLALWWCQPGPKREAGNYSQSWGLSSVCLEVVGSSPLLIYYPRRKKCCMRVSISSCCS